MNDTVIIPTNEFQTPITRQLLDMYSQEVQDQFLDFMDTVPLLKWMVGERPRAKDLPRDEFGRIIVDITHPHILEDMDYFRPAVKFYLENGCYSLLKPNKNPNSEYGKWFYEEVRRCREGYVRESDGEWVTGLMYWYLNYCPIMVTKKSKKTGIVHRVEGFPAMWEGVYYRFHYIEQARKQGKHCIELARRGCGKSYGLGGIMSHNLEVGEDSESTRRVTTVLTAYTKEYLSQKDGTFSKFTPMIDFVATHTEFPRLMLTRRSSDMLWVMGYKDKNKNENGSLNSVMGLSVKDDEGKIRGKRGFILFEEIGNYPNFKDVWDNVRDSVKNGEDVFSLLYGVGCVCAGTKVWLPNGKQINIEDLQKEDGIYGFDGAHSVPESIELLTTPKEKPCVKITLQDKTTLECSVDHPIYVQRKFSYKNYLGNYKFAEHATMHFRYEFVPAGELQIGDRVCEARRIPAFGTETLFDARLVGMLIGDGSYGFDNTPKYSSEDKELLDYVESRYDTGISATHITKKGNIYKDIRVKGICHHLRSIGIYGQVKSNKRLPDNYQTLTEEDTCLMLAGLYDTDGTLNYKDQSIELCQSNREILEQIAVLLRKLGIFGHIVRYEPRLGCGRKDKNPYYRLCVKGRVNIQNFADNIPLLCNHKKETLSRILEYFSSHPSKKAPQYDTTELEISTVKSIEFIGERLVYNMTVSGSHTYIANNIITHNTAGDDASDFSSIRTILYKPEAFEVLALENVYDKKGKGAAKFSYFFPSYISREGCMDKDGNSDVVKAMLQILSERYMVKQGGDPASLLKRIAQMPVTPEEAILRVTSTTFPTVMLNERIRQLDSTPHIYDDIYVGQLVQKAGKVIFKMTDDIPIREYPVDNTTPGALEIYTMPPEGTIPSNRFCIGVDPVDNDQAKSESLMSVIVFDLFNDEIAAEYTGRKQLADDGYEIVRLLSIFYNAQILYESNRKMMYAYFSKKRCLNMLADCPEWITQKGLVKYSLFGSSAKGVSVNGPLISTGIELINDWLKKPYQVEVTDDKGESYIDDVPQLYKIRNRALLEELVSYAPDKNTDRVSALFQVMFYREQFNILYGGAGADTAEEPDASKDEFFEQAWNSYVAKHGGDYQSSLDL